MDLLLAFLGSALRVSVPLLFAAYGGLISERAGLANVALEGLLLMSAFAAAATVSATQNPWLGLAAGVAAGAIGGLIFGVAAIKSRADHIVIGIAFNMLVAGLIPTICRAWFGVTGGTPQLDRSARLTSDTSFFVAALFVGAFLWWAIRATRWGLRLKAAGDEPDALLVQGVSASFVRIQASVLCGAVVGLGGVDLSLCQGSGYIRDMAGGRGFIALAALIFGGWRPVQAGLACLLFASADSIQMLLQGKSVFDIEIPNSIVQVVPYVATLLLLAFRRSSMNAPKAINRPI
jgi:general nucleoside transport system permease protein